MDNFNQDKMISHLKKIVDRKLYNDFNDNIANSFIYSKQLDDLFHKLYHIQYINNEGYVLVKRSPLQNNIKLLPSINNKNILSIGDKLALLEYKIEKMEKSLGFHDQLLLYESRLEHLEKMVIIKSNNELFKEN
jgi:hypothetical protein